MQFLTESMPECDSHVPCSTCRRCCVQPAWVGVLAWGLVGSMCTCPCMWQVSVLVLVRIESAVLVQGTLGRYRRAYRAAQPGRGQGTGQSGNTGDQRSFTARDHGPQAQAALGPASSTGGSFLCTPAGGGREKSAERCDIHHGGTDFYYHSPGPGLLLYLDCTRFP